MTYFSIHKFAFSNLRFSPFYEHFRQLREKYAIKWKIKHIMLISSLRRIWWCTFIWLFLKKTTPPTPLHSPIQNILLTPNPFHCFFAKSLWAGKKLFRGYFIRKIVDFPSYSVLKLHFQHLMFAKTSCNEFLSLILLGTKIHYTKVLKMKF